MLTDSFFEKLFHKHQNSPHFPKTTTVARLVSRLIFVLFPEQSKQNFDSIEGIKCSFELITNDLNEILLSMQEHLNRPAKEIAEDFVCKIPEIYDLLNTDIQAIIDGDPAANSEYEVIRTYPGFSAIAFFRIAHELYELEIPLLPRMITEFAHTQTGIDIHPGARIGHHFFIDHGTGIVIGETAEIGNYVKLYQGVTLGALSVSKNLASLKRHPTIEDNVVIYSGATILGGETTIGANSIIGGNVWLTNSLPTNTKIYHQEQVKIR
ncbi:MAG: serine O-acetyltransferase EpsC [Bacteroidota bacterium]